MGFSTLENYFAFSGSNLYEIPTYQRGYSWHTDEISDFWSDLKITDQNEDKKHFFGSIYITKNAKEQNRYRIVDGQQRITTSAMFLICARDYFYSLKDHNEIAKKHYETLERLLHLKDPKTKEPNYEEPVLNLSRTNKQFFNTYIYPCKPINEKAQIKNYASNDSNEWLANAYNNFSKAIMDEFSTMDNDGVVELNHRCWTLLGNFEIQEINVENDAEAYGMFNLINNRGKVLADSDLIKNLLFGELSEEFSNKDAKELDNYDEIWSSIRDNITGQNDADYDIDVFFEHYLILTLKESVKRTDIFKEFQSLLPSNSDSNGVVKKPAEIIDESFKLSHKFLDLRLATDLFKDDPRISHYLKKIKDIKASNVYPVLLSGYETYYESGNNQLFSKLTEICFKYHIRIKSLSVGINVENYRSSLNDLAVKIHNGELDDVSSIIAELTNKDENNYPTDDKVKSALNKLKLTNAPLATALLEEIERSEDAEKVSGPDVTLEHIMPKNAKKWNEYIIAEHDDVKNNDDARNKHKEYLNWIGNQTLLSGPKNIKNANKLFIDKQIIYGKSGYKITQKLSDITKWTEEQIKDRQDKFEKKIFDIIDLANFK